MTSTPPGAPMSPLEAPCRAIASAAEGVLDWSFDARFRASNAVFEMADQEAVRAILERGFDAAWTSEDIAQAPPRASELAGKLGGLRPGQILFGANADSDPILFGMWWPWGNGASVSIRVLFSARYLDGEQRAALLVDFRSWFGLSD